MDIDLRPLNADDLPAWARLLADVEMVDDTGEHYSQADLAEEMANPDLDPRRDMVGAFLADGSMAGYWCVYPRGGVEDCHQIQMEGTVAPVLRGNGLGSRLAEQMKARGLAVHAERHPRLPALLSVRGLSRNHEQERLLAGIGLLPSRWSFGMSVELTGRTPGPAPRLPDGLELREYDDAITDAMREAHNAAFVDHPDFAPWTVQMWKQWVTGSRSFRPALSRVVVEQDRPERVVAYVQSNEYDADFEATGRREAYVAKVGTRREHRGKGLAGALLAHCLGLYRAAGYEVASLDVDSENPTGALGIYERAGLQVRRRWTSYAVRVPPGA